MDACLLIRCDTMWKSNGVRIAMRRLSDMRRGAVCNVDARKLILSGKGWWLLMMLGRGGGGGGRIEDRG